MAEICGITPTKINCKPSGGGFLQGWLILASNVGLEQVTFDCLNRINTIDPVGVTTFCPVQVLPIGNYANQKTAKTDGQSGYNIQDVTVVIQDNDMNRFFRDQTINANVCILVKQRNGNYDLIGYDGIGLRHESSDDGQGATITNGGAITIKYVAESLFSKTRVLYGAENLSESVRQELTVTGVNLLITQCTNNCVEIATPSVVMSSVSTPTFVVGTPSSQSIVFTLVKFNIPSTTSGIVSFITLTGNMGRFTMNDEASSANTITGTMNYNGAGAALSNNASFTATYIVDGVTIVSNTVLVPIVLA